MVGQDLPSGRMLSQANDLMAPYTPPFGVASHGVSSE